MVAELIVRTQNAEYASGDTIYGAVYLKISGPTGAYGVQIKFFGYETFMYVSKKNAVADDVTHDTKEYVPSEQIMLYEFEDPIALGQYVFPFQKRLPMNLPGSTCLKSADDMTTEWKVEIVYGVEASLMGATGIKAVQNIIITQRLPLTVLNKAETPGGFGVTQNVCLRTWMPLVTTDVGISVCIENQEVFSGDNLKLKLDIERNGLIKPKIESLVFQLMRDLRINFKKLPSKDVETMDYGMTQTLQRFISSQANPRLENELIPTNTLPSGYVHPEGPSFVVQMCRLIDIEGTNAINGIQELLIPLRDKCSRDLPASTIGGHIWLTYSLKVTLKFQRNDPVILHMPITSVLPRFPEWSNWKPGDWVYDCQVMTSPKSICFVSQQILESVQFSALPSFQVV